jgi:hypothetical protein
MDSAFDLLGAVTPGKDSWRFKVRVLRLWNTYSFLKPDVVNSLEMVLIDEKVSLLKFKLILFFVCNVCFDSESNLLLI